jgi:hypothetical protein
MTENGKKYSSCSCPWYRIWGVEIASILSERMGDRLDLTLIDRNDSFYVDFFSSPHPTGTHMKASKALADEKRSIEQGHKTHWFGKG